VAAVGVLRLAALGSAEFEREYRQRAELSAADVPALAFGSGDG
jgi:hypothetical protein